MPLTRADSCAILAEREALLITRCDNVLKSVKRQGDTVRVDSLQQILHGNPACAVQREADAVGFVTQNETEEFAGPKVLFLSHMLKASLALSQSSGIESRPALSATIPPTIAQFVSTSPQTVTVDQSAST